MSDRRDMLRPTIELIKALRPATYLIGNVPGLDDEPNWPIVQTLLGELRPLGYCVRDYARLNAADFGVPQHRVRPFWFGHLEGACIQWPAATHADPDRLRTAQLEGLGELHPWVTVREALGHLPSKDLGTPIKLRWRAHGDPRASDPDAPARTVTTRDSAGDGTVIPTRYPNHRPSSPDEPAKTLTRNTHSHGALLTTDRHPINVPDAPSYTVTTKGDGRGAQGACVVEWPWDRPSTTVVGKDSLAPPGHHERWPWNRPSTAVCSGTDGIAHPGKFRPGEMPRSAIKLSERAAKILQGFPDSWVLAGSTKASRWAQLGQAMPPALAEAVARQIAARAPAFAGKKESA